MGNFWGIFGIFFLEFFGNSIRNLCGFLGNSLGILREFLDVGLEVCVGGYGWLWVDMGGYGLMV